MWSNFSKWITYTKYAAGNRNIYVHIHQSTHLQTFTVITKKFSATDSYWALYVSGCDLQKSFDWEKIVETTGHKVKLPPTS